MLKVRSRQPELMDDPRLSSKPHHQALSGLQRVNWISNTVGRLWQSMLPFADGKCLRVLDVGCGGGDVLCGLARKAYHHGIQFEAIGCDISETACEHARMLAAQDAPLLRGQRLEFHAVDCLHDAVPDDFDVAFCSLFLHHLTEDDAIALLQRLKFASRKAVLVDDLVRSATGYALAWVGTRLLSRSKIVHVDGPLSVEAAFTIAEIKQLAADADMESATITQHWPCRCLLEWVRQ